MRPSRPSRWSVRLVRRYLLVAAAIVVIVLAACAPALADEAGSPAPAPDTQTDTTALARAAIVEGRLVDALGILSEVIRSEAEGRRAPAVELRAIVDEWVATGGAPAPLAATDPTPAQSAPYADVDVLSRGGRTTPAEVWENAYAAARARLVSGDFENAAARFSLLLGSASTGPQSLRAYALASLASELVGKRLVLRTSAPPSAHADRRNSLGYPEARTHSRWYGWQTLVSDGISFVAMPTLAASASKTDGASASFTALAVGGYFLAPPIVHFAHGRAGAGLGSLGLRVAMPFLGAVVGGEAMRKGSCHELCGFNDGTLLGGALGVIGAVAIDATVLSYEQVDDDERSRSRRGDARQAPAQKRFTFSPAFGPRKEGGFDLGVGGAF